MTLKNRLEKLEEKIKSKGNMKKTAIDIFEKIIDDWAYRIITGKDAPLSRNEAKQYQKIEEKYSEVIKKMAKKENENPSDFWQNMEKTAQEKAKDPNFIEHYKETYKERFEK